MALGLLPIGDIGDGNVLGLLELLFLSGETAYGGAFWYPLEKKGLSLLLTLLRLEPPWHLF